MQFLLIGSAAILIMFILLYSRNKTRILNGLVFNLFVCAAGITVVFYLLEMQNKIAYALLGIMAVLVLGTLLFGVYILIALLFLNARIVFKRERRSLANSLTLLLGVALIIFLIVSTAKSMLSLPLWLEGIWAGILVILAYHVFHVLNFLTAVLLSNLYIPPKKQDYIVVLGSGLIGGKVPPLLGARINRAIRFYQKQQKKHRPPKLVMSGGQGADEPVSEARAMAEYAMEKGIPPEDVLLEESSATTYQNMKYSKKLIEEREPGRYRCLYSTSNYHVLRAGIYARRAGLRAEGLGARTALYYLPNALLREYIAVQMMKKRKALMVHILLFAAGFFAVFVPTILDWIIRVVSA